MVESDAARVRLAGSLREPVPGAQKVAPIDPSAELTITVVVRRGEDAGLGPGGGSTEPTGPNPAGPDDATEARRARRRALAAATAASIAASPDDLARVTTFATAHGLTVVEVDPARRTVRISGPARELTRAFGVDLARYEVRKDDSRYSYRGREGYVYVPQELAAVVEAVLGLDDRPQARPELRRGAVLAPDQVPDPAATPVAETPFWAPQVAALYNFPDATAGDGEAVAVIELGGGFTEDDLSAYFGQLNLTPPRVVTVRVDGATNAPGDDADTEVALDIQIAGAVAPRADVIVYFAPNTDAGFYDAVTTAVHDDQNAPSVISISWGAPESQWTAQAMAALDAAFADAAALDVTVLCAAGDQGSGDAAGDRRAHADFPASSPHVVACGGTTLLVENGTISSETVWNDGDGWATGGGVSDVFDVPAWQLPAKVPRSVNGTRRGRGLPDVAGNADRGTGYLVVVEGRIRPIGGTSAVAPLYAGLVARINAALGRAVGELTPRLYALATASEGVGSPFRDVTGGHNGVPRSSFGPAVAGYPATAGWDACTGWGSIDGTALLAALRRSALAATEEGSG